MTDDYLTLKLVEDLGNLQNQDLPPEFKEFHSMTNAERMSHVKYQLESGNFKFIWKYAEFGEFVVKWNRFYICEKGLTAKVIKERLKALPLTAYQTNVVQISSSPKILGFFYYKEIRQSTENRYMLSKYQKCIGFYYPKHGLLAVTSIRDEHGDLDYKLFSSVFGKLQSQRIIAMHLNSILSRNDIITHLSIKTIREISGFDGISKISFEGDHVKLGLYGLHKRQDNRIKLDEMGPTSEVSTKNIDLRIGEEVRIKSLHGFEEFAELLNSF